MEAPTGDRGEAAPHAHGASLAPPIVEPRWAAPEVPQDPPAKVGPLAPASRAAASRGAAVGPEDDDDVDPVERFYHKLQEIDATKAVEAKPAAKVDWSRVAKAHAQLGGGRPAMAKPRALQPAESREACSRCGIPGSKGCAHQAPYEAEVQPRRRA